MCTVHLDGRRARRIAVIIYRLYHFENFIFPVLGRLRFKSVSVGGVLFAYNSVVYSHDQGVMGCSQLRNNKPHLLRTAVRCALLCYVALVLVEKKVFNISLYNKKK